MLSKSSDTTIHVRLMIEFFKYLYDLSSPIMKQDFTKRIPNLRICRPILLPKSAVLIRLFMKLRKFDVCYQQGIKIYHRQIY